LERQQGRREITDHRFGKKMGGEHDARRPGGKNRSSRGGLTLYPFALHERL
jgi:hypothetical protein